MKNRRILIDIDSIMSILKDYTSMEGTIPVDAMPLNLMINPAEKGKLGIKIMSDSLPPGGPILLTFQLKRFYGV